MGSAVVAFSGGVDSTFLLHAARVALGNRVLAVTATSPTYPKSEREEAERIARDWGVPHRFIESNELLIPGFSSNPPERCYHCKKELFGLLSAIAREEGLGSVCDGSNVDDLNDYRPGRRAAKELGVYGITVNAVCPGMIDTELTRESASDELLEQTARAYPIPRLGTALEVADVICFAASEAAGYITGATFDINGGDLMM